MSPRETGINYVSSQAPNPILRYVIIDHLKLEKKTFKNSIFNKLMKEKKKHGHCSRPSCVELLSSYLSAYECQRLGFSLAFHSFIFSAVIRIDT